MNFDKAGVIVIQKVFMEISCQSYNVDPGLLMQQSTKIALKRVATIEVGNFFFA